MFETPLIEKFSRVHPLAPFFFWIPIMGFFLYRASASLGPLSIIGGAIGGALLWSLTEYLLHRFVFHKMGPTFSGRRFFFVLHGVHHDFPTDSSRLVMPLGVSIPMGVTVFLIFRVVFGALSFDLAWLDPIFAGFGAGYLSYDGIHYGTHHFKMASPIGRWLKRYHMVHHHTGEEARWGVSSPLWDIVFRTSGQKRVDTETVVAR